MVIDRIQYSINCLDNIYLDLDPVHWMNVISANNVEYLSRHSYSHLHLPTLAGGFEKESCSYLLFEVWLETILRAIKGENSCL